MSFNQPGIDQHIENSIGASITSIQQRIIQNQRGGIKKTRKI
jgi:hypothetical protein